MQKTKSLMSVVENNSPVKNLCSKLTLKTLEQGVKYAQSLS